ncbi:MAG: FMN reductase (NADPH) [Candidatus Paceibacteria bacterium]|jgi:FMN reductase (NADPH)
MHEQVLDLLRQHRSVRKFKCTPLAPELVRSCVQAAQCAATSSNVQAYCLIQVQDEALRAQLVEATGGQPQVAEAGAFFVVCGDQRRHRLLAQQAEIPYEANLETFIVDVIDAALFAQNLTLAFEAHGLGTCCIGGLRNDLPQVRQWLDLPADVFPLFGLCVGEIEDPSAPRPRLDPEAVLFQDRYPSDEEVLQQTAQYDERMSEHYANRGLPSRNWSIGITRKFKAAAREGLKQFYEEQGARFR